MCVCVWGGGLKYEFLPFIPDCDELFMRVVRFWKM